MSLEQNDLNNNLQNEWKREDEIRFREKNVTLSNQGIIELAYSIRHLVQALLGVKLSVDAGHCYASCFYMIRDLLKDVDAEYLKQHQDLPDFYKQDLENVNDRLYWRNNLEELSSYFLELKLNNLMMKKCCPFCGLSFRPWAPLSVFVNGDLSAPVCEVCAQQYAAELFQAMREADSCFKPGSQIDPFDKADELLSSRNTVVKLQELPDSFVPF